MDLANLGNVTEEQRKLLSETTPYTVRLQPGQVLYVPRHWWHQVSSNTFSISVNTWIESPMDDKARVEEALVRYKVASLCKSLEKEERDYLLNPNEDDLTETDLTELADLVITMARLELNNQTKESELNLSKIQKLTHHIEELKPGCFNFSNIEMKDFPSKRIESNQMKLLRVSTSEAVIEEGVKELRNQVKCDKR